MLPNVSLISICFIIITLITVWFLYEATHQSKTYLFIVIAWLVLQAALGLSNYYFVLKTAPPRFAFLVIPPLLLIAIMFSTRKGKKFIDNIDLKIVTLLHTIRIAVEVILLNLYINKFVPQLMTFEGRNLDIISGITAPFVYYFVFVKQKLGRNFLLIWNFICLALLLNIVVNAMLSIPSLFQKFGYEQPNVAVLYFPFVWLPCCVVPIVLFSHLVAIKQLLNKNKLKNILHERVINTKHKVK